jgi:hypothetical protein
MHNPFVWINATNGFYFAIFLSLELARVMLFLRSIKKFWGISAPDVFVKVPLKASPFGFAIMALELLSSY